MSNSSRSRWKVVVGLLAVASIFSTCAPPKSFESPAYKDATQIALDWNHLLLDLERYTPGYRPPVSARMFAYAEMAAYESALPGIPEFVSLENTCPGYHQPAFTIENYCLPAALNAAYAYIARAFFPTAPVELKERINQLEWRYTKFSYADSSSIKNSIEFGRKTATAVWNFSLLDSTGHDGFLYNYDKNYKIKKCVGCWESNEEREMPPLLPHWGAVRTFAVNAHDIIANPPVPFNETAPSEFFSEAMEVYSISKSLSTQERWIAEFWSDDIPGLTVTPTGRWISIASQAIEKSKVSFPEVMKTYLKTAMALSDAAIVCWDIKYQYQLERPETFIRRNIQSDWTSLHINPCFPSYPSGHAIFGAAAAEVLNGIFGNNFSMTDYTHEGRKEFAGQPRRFNSFEEMAQENAYSRVLIGVHFRMDCEEGLRLGKIVGQKVRNISLQKEQVTTLQREYQ